MPYILAALLLLLGFILLVNANRRQATAGLPRGRLIAADTGAWQPLEKTLYDPHLQLAGKPDYLVETGGDIIPVEVKSSRIPGSPYDSHLYQLAAYCLLVESAYGRRPPYGILHYPEHTFAIDFTAELENALLVLLDEMRALERRRSVPRSHEQPQRCRSCGYRSTCDQRL
jgi:CRISPR-associated exonuclease Cas4